MNITIIKYILTALGSAGLGIFVGSRLSKRKYEQEIDRICAECTEETNAMAAKLKALKEHFVDNAPIEQAGPNAQAWKDISEQHKKELDELNKPVNEEITSHKKDDDIMRPNRTESPDYTSFYKSEESGIAKGVDDLVKTINNDHSEVIEPAFPEGPNGKKLNGFRIIYTDDYIEEDDSEGYEEGYLNYYPNYGVLEDEVTNMLVNANEVPDYTGMTLEEIGEMFEDHRRKHPNEVHEWYIVNQKHSLVYCLNECYSEPPRP